MTDTGLRVVDDDGASVDLAASEAETLWILTEGLDAATVSACPDCRSRVLAALALTDLLDESDAHPRANDLIGLADEAPTAHLYVVDASTDCAHARWRDPGRGEWTDVVGSESPRPRR